MGNPKRNDGSAGAAHRRDVQRRIYDMVYTGEFPEDEFLDVWGRWCVEFHPECMIFKMQDLDYVIRKVDVDILILIIGALCNYGMYRFDPMCDPYFAFTDPDDANTLCSGELREFLAREYNYPEFIAYLCEGHSMGDAIIASVLDGYGIPHD